MTPECTTSFLLGENPPLAICWTPKLAVETFSGVLSGMFLGWQKFAWFQGHKLGVWNPDPSPKNLEPCSYESRNFRFGIRYPASVNLNVHPIEILDLLKLGPWLEKWTKKRFSQNDDGEKWWFIPWLESVTKITNQTQTKDFFGGVDFRYKIQDHCLLGGVD